MQKGLIELVAQRALFGNNGPVLACSKNIWKNSCSFSVRRYESSAHVKILASLKMPLETGPVDQLWTLNDGKSIDQPSLLAHCVKGPFGPLSINLLWPFFATLDVHQTILSQYIIVS